MKKLMVFIIFCIPVYVWGDNAVFNPGFDMSPWDSGWVKDTLTEVSWGYPDTAIANVEINIDTGRSLPNGCYLDCYARASVKPWDGIASANGYAEIFQYFPEVINCTCKIYVKYKVFAIASFGATYAKDEIALFIDGEWKPIWETVCDGYIPGGDTTIWVEVCTTLVNGENVSGIKFSVKGSVDINVGSSSSGGGGFSESNFWIDDVYISKVTGIEKKKEKKKRTIKAYPNPFVGGIALNLSDLKEEEKVRIYNSAGELVEESQENIIGRSLPAGLYFVKIKGYMPIKIIKIWRAR